VKRDTLFECDVAGAIWLFAVTFRRSEISAGAKLMPNKNPALNLMPNGFTMIELVMVMVLAGILAIAIIPRFANKSVFDAKGFFDQSISMLRYAQKVAIAQRTNVFVNANAASGTICLTYVADANCASTTASDKVVALSSMPLATDQSWMIKTVPAGSGITLGGALVFSFSALGKPTPVPDPTPNNAIVVNINGTGVITIERETGYVH
jgi:MSHA pilin protein MshC